MNEWPFDETYPSKQSFVLILQALEPVLEVSNALEAFLVATLVLDHALQESTEDLVSLQVLLLLLEDSLLVAQLGSEIFDLGLLTGDVGSFFVELLGLSFSFEGIGIKLILLALNLGNDSI